MNHAIAAVRVHRTEIKLNDSRILKFRTLNEDTP